MDVIKWGKTRALSWEKQHVNQDVNQDDKQDVEQDDIQIIVINKISEEDIIV
jgi:hypothetical protein